MAIVPAVSPAPRDVMSRVRPHKGVMTFRSDQGNYPKYPIHLGEPNRAGFIPMVKPLGVLCVGVIFLKNEGPVQSGFYPVLPRDIYRRRIDARPCRKLTLEQATLFIGGSLEHLRSREATASGQSAAGADVTSEELVAADLAFKEQVKALHGAEDPEIGV